MKEAHETADRFPDEVWYVLDDDFMSIVKESYFITDEGDRKVKPFVCLYNTKDMKYGYHTIQWVDGEIEIDADDRAKHRFTQPYDTKFVEETERPKLVHVDLETEVNGNRDIVMLGDPHVGHSLALASIMARSKGGSLKNMLSHLDKISDDYDGKSLGGIKYDIPKPIMISDFPRLTDDYVSNDIEVFDLATGTTKKEHIARDMTELKRKQLKKKRKKRVKPKRRKK
jgi:hypothetical protein